MKKFNKRKSVLEQGGLMIEALAMLGLIAVVTPTMYKKSAERTMEVEDINTASAIRTYMNGVESLLAANYTELMEKIEEPQGDEPVIKALDELELSVPCDDPNGCPGVSALEELKKYLPYGYSADENLYNYGNPTFAVARSGNNLSAFMVFPAKATDEDDSIGQERTVRIASLIGSNGGYIRNGSARGVGGTWSVDGSNANVGGKILGDAGDYSIVTSSIDVVHDSDGMGGDMTKYLQRTAENGETWRNTMRTDIYMGEMPNKGEDYDDKTTDGFFSIRNINQLIVGADGYIAANDTSNNQDTDAPDFASLYKGAKAEVDEEGSDTNAKAAFADFGLYIADNDVHSNTRHGINAYIAGSLEAAGRMLFADDEELSYHGPRIQLGGMTDTENVVTDYLIAAVTENDSGFGQNEETENRVEILPVDRGNTEKDPVIIASDNSDKLKDEMTESVTEYDEDNHEVTHTVDGFDGMNLVLAKNGVKDAPDVLDPDDYNDAPEFPVVADSNMAVRGIMAAGQVDTNKLRAASLAVGSEHIDDDLKWMDVDADGVHVHSIDSERDENATNDGVGADSSVVLDVTRSGIYMGADNEEAGPGHGYHGAIVQLDGENQETTIAGNKTRIMSAYPAFEEKAFGMELSTTDVNANEKVGEMVIGGYSYPNGTLDDGEFNEDMQYRVKYNKGGHVDMIGTTLQVFGRRQFMQNSYGGENLVPVFSVLGNDTPESGYTQNYNDPVLNEMATYSGASGEIHKYSVSVHGNTVFSSHDNFKPYQGVRTDMKYLSIGEDPHSNSFDSGVVIARASVYNQTSAGNYKTLYVELGNDIGYTSPVSDGGEVWTRTDVVSRNSYDYEVPNTEGASRKISQGTVFIRKGLIDIAATKPEVNNNGRSIKNADQAKGTVRAARFVANNVDANGNRIKYESPIESSLYTKYNGSGMNYNNKYDTYMVNPAYTSVMKDIKLTSRLGARLSDILPDFITKGLYISDNGYGENEIDVTRVVNNPINTESTDTLPYASPYIGAVPAPQCPPGYGRAIVVTPSSFEMATAGFPTAARVSGRGVDITQFDMLHITNKDENLDEGEVYDADFPDQNELLNSTPQYGEIRSLEATDPATLQMSNVSTGYSESDVKNYYKNGTMPSESQVGTDGNKNMVQVQGGLSATATAEDSGAVQVPNPNGGYLSGHISREHAYLDPNITYADLNGASLQVDSLGYDTQETDTDDQALAATMLVKTGEDSSNNPTYTTVQDAYFLVSETGAAKPLTFQKSTWLKTTTKDVCTQYNTNGDCTGYKQGWAVFMGFVYPKKLYQNVIDKLGISSATSAKLGHNDTSEDDDFYWNIFPVQKGTLASTTTTYCFIDNKKIWSGNDYESVFEDGNGSSRREINWTKADAAGTSRYDIDEYSNWDTSEVPNDDNTATRQQLNDPALKYDELW